VINENTVTLTDCVDGLKDLISESVDAVLTDPPSYKDRSKRSFKTLLHQVGVELLRVLKPGGHAVVGAPPPSSHWAVDALEDVGFEVQDCIYQRLQPILPKNVDLGRLDPAWSGWGTVLPSAIECWWLLRKPLQESTLLKQLQKTRTGALNLEAAFLGDKGFSNLITFSRVRREEKDDIDDKYVKNNQRNVKSIELMLYLMRMVTPSEGLVVDPFCGSGTTCLAAIIGDFRFIGFDNDPEAVKVSLARIDTIIRRQEEYDRQRENVNALFVNISEEDD
jgi:site-specific DNA-methyltransferase (adenine-specific)